jgi:O-antigen/teichoic acid export membrane protein
LPPPPADEPGSSPVESLPSKGTAGSAGLFGKYALLFVADIASRGLRFFADIVLVRHFGPAVFGQLNVAQSLAVQGMSVATCGLDTAGTRDVAATPPASHSIAATVVVLRLLLGVVAWACLAGLTWIIPQYRDSLELAVLYGMSMFTAALTLGWVAQARGWVNVVALSVLATNLMYFGGVQAVALFGWPPWSAPLVLIFGELLTATGLWLWIARKIGPVRRPLPAGRMLQFLRRSLPIGGANIMRGLVVGSDVLLLGLFVGKAQVGIYSGAFKLYSLGLSLIILYFTILLPHLASQVRDEPTLKTGLYSALTRALLAAIPITVAGIVLSRAVLHLLFGGNFEEATTALQILILALPLHLAAGHFRSAFVALGRQRLDLRLVALAAIVHVAVKLLLIPRLGITGAASGTFVGEAALFVLAWHAGRSVLRQSAAG